MGTLYYGDNLDILRRYLKDETVNLVYLDPPFNSAQTYNGFFHEKDGTEAASQIRAFEDTWHRDIETKRAYDLITERADGRQGHRAPVGGRRSGCDVQESAGIQEEARAPERAAALGRLADYGLQCSLLV